MYSNEFKMEEAGKVINIHITMNPHTSKVFQKNFKRRETKGNRGWNEVKMKVCGVEKFMSEWNSS